MMFKKLAVVLIVMLLIFSVAGFRSSIVNAKEDSTIVWSGWSGEETSTKPSITTMIDSWNAKNPNTTVKWVGWPYSNALEQLIIRSQGGGELLDVAQVSIGWLKTLTDADVLLDLSTVFDANWLKDNFEEASLEVGRRNGKQIAIPWTIASIGTVYNPVLLEKAGVKEVPKTIQEFEDALKKLKESDSSIIPYAVSTKGQTSSDFYPWLWAFGGSVFDKSGNVVINNDAGVKTLTWCKSLLDKGYIKMDISRFDARQLYAQNKVGFYNDAIMAKEILRSSDVADAEKYIVPMLRPVINAGDTPQSTMWGHALVIFKQSENPQKTAEFIKHIVGNEQSLMYFKNTGMLPVMKSAIMDDNVQKDIWSKEWLEITKSGKDVETSNYKEKKEIDTIVMEEIQAALIGKKTPQKALDDAAARITSAIK